MRGFCFGPPVSLRAVSSYADGHLNIRHGLTRRYSLFSKDCDKMLLKDVVYVDKFQLGIIEIMEFVTQRTIFLLLFSVRVTRFVAPLSDICRASRPAHSVHRLFNNTI